jgi:hypothetical protein
MTKATRGLYVTFAVTLIAVALLVALLLRRGEQHTRPTASPLSAALIPSRSQRC